MRRHAHLLRALLVGLTGLLALPGAVAAQAPTEAPFSAPAPSSEAPLVLEGRAVVEQDDVRLTLTIDRNPIVGEIDFHDGYTPILWYDPAMDLWEVGAMWNRTERLTAGSRRPAERRGAGNHRASLGRGPGPLSVVGLTRPNLRGHPHAPVAARRFGCRRWDPV